MEVKTGAAALSRGPARAGRDECAEGGRSFDKSSAKISSWTLARQVGTVSMNRAEAHEGTVAPGII